MEYKEHFKEYVDSMKGYLYNTKEKYSYCHNRLIESFLHSDEDPSPKCLIEYGKIKIKERMDNDIIQDKKDGVIKKILEDSKFMEFFKSCLLLTDDFKNAEFVDHFTGRIITFEEISETLNDLNVDCGKEYYSVSIFYELMKIYYYIYTEHSPSDKTLFKDLIDNINKYIDNYISSGSEYDKEFYLYLRNHCKNIYGGHASKIFLSDDDVDNIFIKIGADTDFRDNFFTVFTEYIGYDVSKKYCETMWDLTFREKDSKNSINRPYQVHERMEFLFKYGCYYTYKK